MFIRGLLTLTLFMTVLPWPDSAHAATAYVKGCGFANGGASTTVACSPGAVSATNLMVGAVAFSSSTATVSGCTDGTNVFTIVPETLHRDLTNNRSIQGFYVESIGALTSTVTCTFSTSISGRGIVLHEVSGTLTSGALDQKTGQSEQNPGTGTDAINSTAVTTTTDGKFIFAATYDTSHDCAAVAAGTGYTIRDVTGCVAGVSYSESQIQTSAGSIDGTFTTSNGGATDFATIIMTFRAAADAAILQSHPVPSVVFQ